MSDIERNCRAFRHVKPKTPTFGTPTKEIEAEKSLPQWPVLSALLPPYAYRNYKYFRVDIYFYYSRTETQNESTIITFVLNVKPTHSMHKCVPKKTHTATEKHYFKCSCREAPLPFPPFE